MTRQNTRSISNVPCVLRRVTQALIAVGALGASAASLAIDPFTVRDIRVEGLQRTDPGTVFNYLGVKVGDRFDDDAASAAIKALFGTGFFRDVRIEVLDGVLIVSVVERPTVSSIDVVGAKEFDKDTLKKALRDAGLSEGRIFDKTILDKAEQEIKKQYLSRGRYDVTVTTTLTPLERNRTAISIDVKEGEIARIESINIIGASAVSDKELLGQMQLALGGWFSWYTKDDQYSKQKLQADLESIRAYYTNRGYLEFNVDSTQVSLSPDKTGVYININITEGAKFIVSGVTVGGELLLPEAELRSLIRIQPGDVFNRTRLADGAKAISDRLGREGYAFAGVNAVPEINREKQTVAFNFVIDPGRRVYVRRINVAGNVQTRDEVIRREIRQLEASWYDQAKIQRSKVRLERLGFFSEVTMDNAAVAGSGDQVDVDVAVTEKNTGSLNAGAGYSSAEKLVLTASISQNNVLGTGNSLALQVNTSRSSKTAVIGYTNPYWTADGISRTIDVYRRTYDPTSSTIVGNYSLATTGAGVRFGVPISETDSVSIGVSGENSKLGLTPGISPQRFFDYTKEFGTNNNTFKVSGGWARDTRDSLTYATRGWLQSIGIESTIPVTQVKYYKLNYQGQVFVPLWSSLVYGLNIDAGYGNGYGGRSLPFFQNYYGGGVGSVRGFDTNSLGPREPSYITKTENGVTTTTAVFNGNATGGRRKFSMNNEILFPFPGTKNDKSVRGSVFFDAGQIYDRSDSQQKDNQRVHFSTGLAIAWQSPIGALKFSYAFPLSTKPNDKLQRFQFQVGTLF